MNANSGFRQGLAKKFLEFLPIFKAFFPERCLDLRSFIPEYALKIT